MAQTQTLQLQYHYTLNLHFLKVLSLPLFTERLYKASNIFMGLVKNTSSEIINYLDLYFQSLSWPLEAIKILFAYNNHLIKAKSSLDFNIEQSKS